MSNERTRSSTPRDPSFAKVGMLQSARVNPVVLTAAQSRYGVDNSLSDDNSHHHDSHHDGHVTAARR